MGEQLEIPRRLNIRHVLTKSPPVPDHVLPGLPLGAVGALVAPGGTGKTMLLLQTAVALASGLPVLEGLLDGTSPELSSRAPARIVLAVAEETAEEMHRRLHAVVSHMLRHAHSLLDLEHRDLVLARLEENLHIYPLAGGAPLLLDDATGGLRKLRQMSVGARLVVIDPLRQFHTGDENDSWAMTVAVQACQRIAANEPCAVIAAHHTNKLSTLNGMGERAGAARGSAAFTDGVRWQLNLSGLDEQLAAQYGIAVEDRHGYIRADVAKANYIAPRPPQVLRREAVGVLSLVVATAAKRRGRK